MEKALSIMIENNLEVVYATSDGCFFTRLKPAQNWAEKQGIELISYEKSILEKQEKKVTKNKK